MSTIVTGGYGQPEEGAIVAGGMGATEPAPPGSISASLSGVGAITATLTNGAPPVEPVPEFAAGGVIRLKDMPEPAYLSAALTGSATVTATADIVDWSVIYDWNNALILELV